MFRPNWPCQLAGHQQGWAPRQSMAWARNTGRLSFHTQCGVGIWGALAACFRFAAGRYMGPMGDAIPCLPQPHRWLHLVECLHVLQRSAHAIGASALALLCLPRWRQVLRALTLPAKRSWRICTKHRWQEWAANRAKNWGCRNPLETHRWNDRLSTAAMDLCLAETCKRSFRVSHGGRGRDRDTHTDRQIQMGRRGLYSLPDAMVHLHLCSLGSFGSYYSYYSYWYIP